MSKSKKKLAKKLAMFIAASAITFAVGSVHSPVLAGQTQSREVCGCCTILEAFYHLEDAQLIEMVENARSKGIRVSVNLRDAFFYHKVDFASYLIENNLVAGLDMRDIIDQYNDEKLIAIYNLVIMEGMSVDVNLQDVLEHGKYAFAKHLVNKEGFIKRGDILYLNRFCANSELNHKQIMEIVAEAMFKGMTICDGEKCYSVMPKA